MSGVTQLDTRGIMLGTTQTGGHRANGPALGTEGKTSMQGQTNRFGVERPDQIGLVLRTARKQWDCASCEASIPPRRQYVEYLGESHAYESGTRYCLACAEDVWSVRSHYGILTFNSEEGE